MPIYSRLARVEQSRNIKKSIIYIFLSIIIIVILVVFGLPLIARLAGFLGDIKKTSTPVEQEDITPPAPPSLTNIPEFTNRKILDIRGVSEPGTSVIIVVNGIESEILADKNGEFSTSINLIDGQNTLTTYAKDSSGNESQKSENYTIGFDTVPPELEFLSPSDGTNFYGTKQRQVVIEGKTEPDVKLTINDRIVVVDSEGIFTFTTTLSEGDNNFNAKAEDPAGNKTEDGITLHYWY